MSIPARRYRRRLRRVLCYAVLPVLLAGLVGAMAVLIARDGRAATTTEVAFAAGEILGGIDEAPTGLLSANGGYDTPRIILVPPEDEPDVSVGAEVLADARAHTRRLAAALRKAADGRYRILDLDVVARLEAVTDDAPGTPNILDRADVVVVATIEKGRSQPRVVYQAIARPGGDLLASASLRLSRAADLNAWVEESTPPAIHTPPASYIPPTIVDNSIDSEPIADNSLDGGAVWHGKFRRTVAEAQERLWDLGYDPGPVTGVLNESTRAAIRAYQRDSALMVSGRMTRNTMENMRRDSRVPGPLARGDF